MNATGLTRQVSAIIRRVKSDGDEALRYYTGKFDGPEAALLKFAVSGTEIAAAARKLDPGLRRAIDKAAANIEAFHRAERSRLPLSWTIRRGASVTGQLYRPVESAGLYVPGGRFSYPSTVLMTAIPARVAGVGRTVMVSPPGRLTPAVLYAAAVSGVHTVYRVGGPAAIAALAYGTRTIPRVDLIVGPGNAYVNEAKRQVMGVTGIDSLAGPSEVAIIADAQARPDFIVADLLAQAEHDPLARSYLFSDSSALLARVRKLLPEPFHKQVHAERTTLARAVEKVNALAPEHLQLMVRKPAALLKDIRNAGAVFAGDGTPTAAGDYWAGPSHVLPTGGTARFSSGLSVLTFLKRMSYISYPLTAIEESIPYIESLARAEGLEYHGRSAGIRRTTPRRV